MFASGRRQSSLIALAAGTLYAIQTIIGLASPQAETFAGVSDYALEAVFVAALLLTLPALLTVFQYGIGTGRLGLAGCYTAAGGTALMLISAAATLVGGANALGLLFVLGLLAAALGQLLLGAAVARAKLLPAWAGLGLALALPVSVLLASYGGGMFVAAAWMIIGGALFPRIGTRVGTPAS